ncbi:hypothetical protein ACTI_52640 [Actinoplanes sp. OR16]|nr:hypothetical protein [Actinoplanes sp. OR16]BBH68579.1 hypothetical protein ACTI_52640 [Actinoplanes sp. OR16]
MTENGGGKKESPWLDRINRVTASVVATAALVEAARALWEAVVG